MKRDVPVSEQVLEAGEGGGGMSSLSFESFASEVFSLEVGGSLVPFFSWGGKLEAEDAPAMAEALPGAGAPEELPIGVLEDVPERALDIAAGGELVPPGGRILNLFTGNKKVKREYSKQTSHKRHQESVWRHHRNQSSSSIDEDRQTKTELTHLHVSDKLQAALSSWPVLGTPPEVQNASAPW